MGLGKGLNALIKETEESVEEKNPTEIEISKIMPNPNQPRKQLDGQKLDELSASIEQHGVLQPILVRPKGTQYEIVAGERRYTAAKKAGLKKIPAIVRQVDKDKMLTLALIENVQRDNLNPVEEALSYRELLEEQGFNQTSLAKEISKSRPVISNALRLLELPDYVLKLLKNGEISVGHARAIVSIESEEKQIKMAEKILQQKLSVRDTEQLASFSKVSKKEATKKSASWTKSFSHVTAELKKMLGRSVRIRSQKEGFKIEIPFSDETDLQKVIEKIKQGIDYEKNA